MKTADDWLAVIIISVVFFFLYATIANGIGLSDLEDKIVLLEKNVCEGE